MARQSTFPLWDLAHCEGRLAALLAGWRAERLSLFEITRRLDAEYSVRVTPDTVRRWLALPEVVAAVTELEQAS